MEFETKLNRNAQVVNYEKSEISKNLEEFFTILFTSWDANNVDSIISRITIETIRETDLFYRELFINIYRLATKSETNVKADNAIIALNTLDTIIPELLMVRCDETESILIEYDNIKEKAFLECFDRIKTCCKLFLETRSKNMCLEIKNVLLVLTKLSTMRYFELFVIDFSNLLWGMFSVYRQCHEIVDMVLYALSNISNQLVKFLLWNVDVKNKRDSIDLVLKIFATLKIELIDGKFLSGEIVYVLHILDIHDRFLGQYYDAVPENTLEEGIIICSSQTKTLESEEVYEDYEKFLLNECD